MNYLLFEFFFNNYYHTPAVDRIAGCIFNYFPVQAFVFFLRKRQTSTWTKFDFAVRQLIFRGPEYTKKTAARFIYVKHARRRFLITFFNFCRVPRWAPFV